MAIIFICSKDIREAGESLFRMNEAQASKTNLCRIEQTSLGVLTLDDVDLYILM